jgi:hypothetical protein
MLIIQEVIEFFWSMEPDHEHIISVMILVCSWHILAFVTVVNVHICYLRNKCAAFGKLHSNFAKMLDELKSMGTSTCVNNKMCQVSFFHSLMHCQSSSSIPVLGLVACYGLQPLYFLKT